MSLEFPYNGPKINPDSLAEIIKSIEYCGAKFIGYNYDPNLIQIDIEVKNTELFKLKYFSFKIENPSVIYGLIIPDKIQ